MVLKCITIMRATADRKRIASSPAARRKSTASRGKSRAKRKVWDKHELYERCVLDAAGTAVMLDSDYRRIRGRRASTMREDFAGTSAIAAAWAALRPENRAMAVDLDPEPQEWGRARHIAGHPFESRVEVVTGNVLDENGKDFDLICAFNFSWQVFLTRPDLMAYLRRVRASLAPDGIFELDMYGGTNAITEQEERTRMGNVTYMWDQVEFDPTTAQTHCAIHFRLPDGKIMRNAFTYHWRLWGLRELIEIMEECGLRVIELQNEDSDEDDKGAGTYTPVKRIPNWESWLAKVLAERDDAPPRRARR